MSSAILPVVRLAMQLNLLLVRIQHKIRLHVNVQSFSVFTMDVAEPPRVTNHPLDTKDAVPGKPVKFTLQATGTEPLNFHWQWKPAGEEDGSEEWQPCRAEWSDGATLTIPSVQKSNEGSYRCVISNCAGSQTSEPAYLSVGKTT